MLDSSLSSVFPSQVIGGDGFKWWIGQVEAKDTDPPFSLTEKSSNRYKVRIVGKHLKEGANIPTSELPWAMTMLPVTTPYSDGGVTGAVPKLTTGSWVVGFFLDPEGQKPMILGSIGHTAGSTVERNNDPNPNATEKGFTTYTNSKSDPYTDLPENYEASGPTKVGERGGVADSSATTITSQIKSFYGDNNASTPGGYNFCVSIADPNCGSESDVKGEFSRILGEMLAATQNSGGRLGDYIVGQAMGEITSITDTARRYINKMLRVVKTLLARVKGIIVEKIRQAIKWLTDSILRPDESGNSLTPVTKFFNKLLADLGCKMADLGQRLEQWLTDLLFNYIYTIFKNAACQVDILVNGIIAEIQSLLDELLESILGPLQSILGGVASALNIIGGAINTVLKLLGIQCDGPGTKCQKRKTVCTDCSAEKGEQDFLDKLLEDLEDGPLEPDYVCSDAIAGIQTKDTEVEFVGGSFVDQKSITYTINDIKVSEGQIATFTVTRTGYTAETSSLKYYTLDGTAKGGSDYTTDEGIVGFSPGETEKEIKIQTLTDDEEEGKEDFFVVLSFNTPIDGSSITSDFKKNVGQCFIVKLLNPISPLDETDLENLEIPENDYDTTTNKKTVDPITEFVKKVGEDYDPKTKITVDGIDTDLFDYNDGITPSYSVKAFINGDKTSSNIVAKEGDFILYVIDTLNVTEGTKLYYTLYGTGITTNDILGGQLTGSFIINNNKALVTVGIEEDTELESVEALIFSINGTGATATVLIDADDTIINKSEDDIIEYTPPTTPTVIPPITDDNGGIIDIQIDDQGDSYVEPPTVFITGAGFGAKGLALLDDKGKVSEIRILQKGSGYKINTPESNNLQCIIDSFTLVRPGKGYTEAPTVYVDGRTDVARAVIDEQGFIVSLIVLDRYTKYTRYPDITILGGNGFGALFVPNLVCLDNVGIESAGVAKIGTGKYIDCP